MDAVLIFGILAAANSRASAIVSQQSTLRPEPMKILLISYFYPPIQSVASTRLESFAQTFAELGHEVEVLTVGGADLPARESRNGVWVNRITSPVLDYLHRRFANLKDGNAPVSRDDRTSWILRLLARVNRFRISRGLGFLGRMPDFSDLWAWRARHWLSSNGPWDCVIASYAPYSTLILGRLAKRHGRCGTLVLDFRDLWTEHHLFRGLFPFTLVERILERTLIREASLVTTVSPELAQRLEPRLAPGTSAMVVYNGYSRTEESARAPITRAENSLLLVHTGSLYAGQQDVLPLFAAIRELPNDSKARLQVVFAGANRADIEDSALAFGIDSVVKHVGLISHGAALALQAEADILLHFDLRHLTYDGVLPCKLFEYASTGKEILFLRERRSSSAMRFLQRVGTVSAVENATAGITGFLSERLRERAPRLSYDAEYVRNFSRERQAAALLDRIQACVAIRTLPGGIEDVKAT